MLFTFFALCCTLDIEVIQLKYISARKTTNSDNKSLDFFEINNCGAFIDASKPIVTSRPDGRMDFLLIYVSAGALVLEGERRIKSGNVMLFRPHEPQMYHATVGSTYYWIHFSGTAADNMLEFFKDSSYNIGVFPEFEEFCHECVNAFAAKKNNYTYFCIGKLISLIAMISQKLSAECLDASELIAAAFSDIHTNFTLQRSNDEYAKMCDISKSHFIRLFHSSTGLPPQKYRTAIVMREAKHLLKSNTVAATASILGYDDAFYFSRIFKKTVGVSPIQYKKQL